MKKFVLLAFVLVYATGCSKQQAGSATDTTGTQHTEGIQKAEVTPRAQIMPPPANLPGPINITLGNGAGSIAISGIFHGPGTQRIHIIAPGVDPQDFVSTAVTNWNSLPLGGAPGSIITITASIDGSKYQHSPSNPQPGAGQLNNDQDQTTYDDGGANTSEVDIHD